MSAWIVIPCLKQLDRELWQLAPNRDMGASGTVGDLAHQERTSDHNPDETGAVPVRDADKVNEVHALDADVDLRQPGLTMEMIVQHVLARCRSGAEKRLTYIIYNRRIWSASSGWAQKAYGGSDPHVNHAHFSASYNTQLEASTASWHLEDIPVALTEADKKWIADLVATQVGKAITSIPTAAATQVWAHKLDNPQTVDDVKNPGADDKAAGVWLQYAPSYGRIDAVGAKVDAARDAILDALKPDGPGNL